MDCRSGGKIDLRHPLRHPRAICAIPGLRQRAIPYSIESVGAGAPTTRHLRVG
jgi:hypothetical protein